MATVDPLEPGDPAELAGRLHARFVAVHGRPPVGVWSAPGRVNLIGEHTDYNAGLCLPVALPHATYAAAAPRADGLLTLRSAQVDSAFEAPLDALGPGGVSGWAAYAAGTVWALRGLGIDVPGLDVLVDSTVPVGAGLSSSAALECAVAVAACELAGAVLDEALRARLVPACIRAETEVVGAPTGGMDQTASLRAAPGHALLLDCRDGGVTHLPVDLGAAGLTLLAIDTRAPHVLADGQYAMRRDQCERAATLLGVGTLREATSPATVNALDDPLLRRRARHVVTEIARVEEAAAALRAGEPRRLGPLFLASHASLRDDFEVSCAALDVVVDTAMDHGALGARMTGGGFGGSAIVLVHREVAEVVVAAVGDAFASRGWAPPGVLTGHPSGPAARVR